MLDLERNAEELLDQAKRALRFDPQIGPALSEEEREDLASDAYERLLRRRRDGRIHNGGLASLAQKTALNLARNHLAHRKFQGQGDPTDESFGGSSEELGPDEALFTKVDLAGGIEAAEQLPREQMRVYRALVVDELTPAEAIKRLRMRRSTFFKYRKLAFDHVTSALLDGEDSPAARERLKLLAAYDAGIADARQRARVRRLLKNDPSARAELLALRRSHEVAAIGLPVFVFDGDTVVSAAGVGERAEDAIGRARDALANLFQRGAADTADAASAISTSGAGRAGGVAGAGLLAKIAAVGTGGQVAAACVAGGGVAIVACVATGVLPGPSTSDAERQPAQAAERSEERERPRVRPLSAAALLPSQVGHETTPPPKPEPDAPPAAREAGSHEQTAGEPEPVASEPTLEPSAPPVAQEFGVPAAGVPAEGAAAPPSSTQDGGPATASEVEQQFGP